MVHQENKCIEYGIGETTINGIFKQKDKLMSFASMSDKGKRKKIMKNSSH